MVDSQSNLFNERESWKAPLVMSVGFHVLVVLTLVVLGLIVAPRPTSNWGENPGEAIDAKLVSGAPVPIPKPETPTENIVATESKGVTQTVPQTKPAEPEEKAVPVQSKTVAKPTPQKALTAANVKPRPLPTPTTAVPYGEGGAPTTEYGVFTSPNSKGGFNFQNANFGKNYGWYVDVVKRKVQSNWLTYELDPRINAPHRGYIAFDILRDGRPDNIHLAQSSGVPALDISAKRAVERIDTFGATPDGNKVSVEFWFDYPPK